MGPSGAGGRGCGGGSERRGSVAPRGVHHPLRPRHPGPGPGTDRRPLGHPDGVLVRPGRVADRRGLPRRVVRPAPEVSCRRSRRRPPTRYDAAYRLSGRHAPHRRQAGGRGSRRGDIRPDGAVGTADAGGDGASSDDGTGGDPDGDPEPGADLQNDRPGGRADTNRPRPSFLLPAGHRDPDGPPRRLVEPPASGLSSSGQNLTAALCPSWLRGDKSSTEIRAYTYFPDGLWSPSPSPTASSPATPTGTTAGWSPSSPAPTRRRPGEPLRVRLRSDGNRISHVQVERHAGPARGQEPHVGGGARSRYDYDNLGRLVAVTYPAAGP